MLRLVLVCFLLPCALSLSPVTLVVSDSSGFRMRAMPQQLHWERALPGTPSSVLLDTTRVYQQIDGFGGSFLRSGAITLGKLSMAKQEEILRHLFDVAGLSVGKVPIGSCDYCLLSEEQDTTWWSYREMQNETFSLGPDLVAPGGTIPYIRRAQSHASVPLWIQATMDYAPVWMQDGKLPKAGVAPKHYQDMAQYFLDYSLEFKKHAGFPLKYLSLFNEPSDSYTFITNEQIADLLVNHVGPLFRASGPDAPLLTYATQADRATTWKRTPEILRIPGVLQYTDVLFYHGYDCNPWVCTGLNNTCPGLSKYEEDIDRLHAAFPQFKLWMTEVCYAEEYGNFPPPPACPPLPLYDFEDGLQWGKMIVADLTQGHSSAWIYWNMILDQHGGPHLTSAPHNDPKVDIQHPLVIVNTDTKHITYTGAFWFLAHFGKFVARGMNRMGTTAVRLSVNVYHVAFVDVSSGEVVVQLINDSPQQNTVHLAYNQSLAVTVELGAVSITTLRFHE